MNISRKSSIPASSSPKTALRLGLLLVLLVLAVLAGVAAGSTSIHLFSAFSEIFSGAAQSAAARS